MANSSTMADRIWEQNLSAKAVTNAGPTSIGKVSDGELPSVIRMTADKLNFGTKFDVAYHAHKHAGELGNGVTPTNEAAVYLQRARALLRVHRGSVRWNQNGSRSVVVEAEGMRAIVTVSADGEASISTFGRSP